MYPNDSNPFIWVLKDSTAFVIRLITLPPKAFTLDEEKDKETVLAKAALGHL